LFFVKRKYKIKNFNENEERKPLGLGVPLFLRIKICGTVSNRLHVGQLAGVHKV
jgi:hypothetical protein